MRVKSISSRPKTFLPESLIDCPVVGVEGFPGFLPGGFIRAFRINNELQRRFLGFELTAGSDGPDRCLVAEMRHFRNQAPPGR